MLTVGLLSQLGLATIMVVTAVILHLLGLLALVRLLRAHDRWISRLRVSRFTLLVCASLGLFALHTTEIWLYGLLYFLTGAISDFEAALYFSTVTYATVGYGDVVLPPTWRIFGAIEGATGIILLGWSTAFLVSLLVQLKFTSGDWLSDPKRRSGVNELPQSDIEGGE